MERKNEISNAAFGFITNSATALFMMLVWITRINTLIYEIIFAFVIGFVVVLAAKNYAELQVLKSSKEDKK